MKHGLLVFALLLIASSCRDSESGAYFKNCASGIPQAIFSKDVPQVRRHSFRLRRTEAVETIQFESGKKLTITQTGCESIRQEFQFELPGSFPDDDPPFWIGQAIEEFEFLAGLDTGYLMFSSWAQAIASRSDGIRLAESTEIQPGFYVRIDRIVSADHAILSVILSETP